MAGQSFKKLVEDMAAQLGYSEVRHLSSGHLEAIHPNGEKVRLPLTPRNEWRGKRNARAALERGAGKKLPRANAGKGKGMGKRESFADTAPTVQSPRSIERERLLAQIKGIDGMIREAISEDTEASYAEAKRLMRMRFSLETKAAEKGIRVREFYL